MLRAWLLLLWASGLCCEHHTPITSVMPYKSLYNSGSHKMKGIVCALFGVNTCNRLVAEQDSRCRGVMLITGEVMLVWWLVTLLARSYMRKLSARLLDMMLFECVGCKAVEMCSPWVLISWLSHLIHEWQAPRRTRRCRSKLEVGCLRTVYQRLGRRLSYSFLV